MNAYSAVSAKIRAMYGKQLTMEDYENLLSKSSVSEMCMYLKNETAYKDMFVDVNPQDMHRELIEHRLFLEAGEEYARIYGFLDSSQQSVLEFWHYRTEIKFLKECLMRVFSHESIPMPEPEVSHFLKTHTRIDMEKCIKANTISDFADALKETPYGGIFKRAEAAGADFFTIAMTLDGFYFKRLMEKAQSVLSEDDYISMKKLVGSKCDMLNIMWIYRGKRYFNIDPKIIYTYLIPVRYKITEDEIKVMAEAPDFTDIVKMLEKGVYGELFYKVGEGIFPEENCRRMLYKNSKSFFRKEPSSMAAIFSYLYLKEFELLNITRAIEGVRYGIERSAVLKRIKFSREAI